MSSNVDGSAAAGLAGGREPSSGPDLRTLQEQLRESTRALGERVKELTCLYGISKVLDLPGLSLSEVVQRIADLLPLAMQHPQLAGACIELGSQVFATPLFVDSSWVIASEILVNSKPVGRVRVGYSEGSPANGEGAFLAEERDLVAAVAMRLGKVVERTRAEEALDAQRRTLQAVLDNMPAGVYLVDARDGHGIMANQRAEELLARPLVPSARTDELARTYGVYVSGTDQPYPEERMPLVRGMRGETAVVEDMEVEHPNGSRVLLQVFGGPVRDATGCVTSSVAIFQDITARRAIEDQQRRDERRLNSLLELSQKALDLSEAQIVQEAVETAEALTESQMGYVHFVNQDQKTIHLKAWSKKTLENCTSVPEEHYPVDRAGVWADCVRLGLPVIHNDYQGLPDRKGYPEGHSHLVRHASVPIFDGDKAAIVMGVGNKLEDYDESDVRHLTLIGDQLLRIVQRKRAEDALQESEERFRTALLDAPVPTMIHAEDGEVVAVNKVWTGLSGYTQAQIATVEDWAERAYGQRRPSSARDFSHPYVLDERVRGGEQDITTSSGEARTWELRSAPLGRLKDGRRLVVSIAMDVTDRKRTEEAANETNRRLSAQLAEIERLQAELREQAAHDPLTGLQNRRSFDEAIGRELVRAKREGYPIGVVMLDIDHFKSVNDTFGHLAGDELLRAMAAMLRANARRSDVLCRLGGDEFLVLMPRATCDRAAERAEQWRREFEGLRVASGDEAVSATLSIGVAVLSPGTEGVDTALKEADAALYLSKAKGRNRVTVSSELCP